MSTGAAPWPAMTHSRRAATTYVLAAWKQPSTKPPITCWTISAAMSASLEPQRGEVPSLHCTGRLCLERRHVVCQMLTAVVRSQGASCARCGPEPAVERSEACQPPHSSALQHHPECSKLLPACEWCNPAAGVCVGPMFWH